MLFPYGGTRPWPPLQRGRLTPEPYDLLKPAIVRQLPEVYPVDSHGAVAAGEPPGEAQLVVVKVGLARHVDARARHLAVHAADERDQRLPPGHVRPRGGGRPVVSPGLLQQPASLALVRLVPR